MLTLMIYNEFLHSPIWAYKDDIVTETPSFIKNDPVCQKLCKEITERYTGYFEEDSHDQPLWFDEAKEKREKDVMLDLIRRLKLRLEEINDGTFIVEDNVSESLRTL